MAQLIHAKLTSLKKFDPGKETKINLGESSDDQICTFKLRMRSIRASEPSLKKSGHFPIEKGYGLF